VVEVLLDDDAVIDHLVVPIDLGDEGTCREVSYLHVSPLEWTVKVGAHSQKVSPCGERTWTIVSDPLGDSTLMTG